MGLALLGACLLVGGLSGCNSNGSSKSNGTEVTYAVVGTACNADITYQDLAGAQILLPGLTLPWNLTFEVPASQVDGFPLYLSATNNCVFGTLTVNAVVNGALYASNTTNVANGTAFIQVSLF